jgi:hypothetical protein
LNPFNKLPKPVSAFDGPVTLRFSLDNAKLVGTKTAAFSLPAGYSCPGACDCLAFFNRETNKLEDGPRQKHRCFAASLEAAFPSVRVSVDRNYNLLKAAKTVEEMAELIHMSLPGVFYENIRIHADGDFYSANYFLAWCEVARRNPERIFYAYTKSLPFWVKFQAVIPKNLVLTASWGGKWDELIDKHELRNAKVVLHPDEAKALNLKLDHDDSLARDPKVKAFCLLIHGVQPAGSEPAAAIKRMKTEGVEYTYGRKSKPKSKV